MVVLVKQLTSIAVNLKTRGGKLSKSWCNYISGMILSQSCRRSQQDQHFLTTWREREGEMIKDLFALNLDGFDGVHLCPLNWLIDLVLCSITLVSNLAFVEVCQHSSTPDILPIWTAPTIAIVLALVLFFAAQWCDGYYWCTIKLFHTRPRWTIPPSHNHHHMFQRSKLLVGGKRSTRVHLPLVGLGFLLWRDILQRW